LYWPHLIEHLGDKAQAEALGPFRDSANLDEVRGLRRMYQGRKSFWTHPMELLGDAGHVKSRFGLFGDRIGVAAS
jgi:hypothetical protein